MIRSMLALAILGAACNPPTCGKGTKEHQNANGDVECIPVDGMLDTLDCDVDAGAHIVGGKCVSAITCGANTELVGNECVGTGGATPHQPKACMQPGANQMCVNGVVRHLIDNSFLASGEMVRVWVVDPLQFLANPSALAQSPCPTSVCLAPPVDTDDTYTFNNLRVPQLATAVAVGDAAGTLQVTGTGGLVTAGQKYQIDSYATPKTLAQSWATQSGFDLAVKGIYIARFFMDPAPQPNAIVATETMPLAGVTLTESGGPTAAKYFGADFMTIGTGTSTSAFGAAILQGTGDTQVLSFSGMGGGVATWETHPGNTTANVVFVDRFHPMP
jgi:hypothetical protein